MITIATLLWDANAKSRDFSTAYDESWVDKLYRGFARNLTAPFHFVCFTDRPRQFSEPVQTHPIESKAPDYSTCIEPYRLNVPMILVGLDTVIVGPCDDLAAYCFAAELPAFPLDPYRRPNWRRQICNGVGLIPGGLAETMYAPHAGQNDMDWVASHPHATIDALFPGRVVSYKARAKAHGIAGTSIVYFHGQEKPGEHQTMRRAPWIAEHWR